MKTKVSCYNVARMVIAEATKQFAPLWSESDEKKDLFKHQCSAIDDLAYKYGANVFEVEVDDIALTILVSFECPEISIETPSYQFCNLVEEAIETRFSVNSETGDLIVGFKLPGIWAKS